MPRQNRALALCRVSSIEQLQNNSLNRQRASVLREAQNLGVVIPDDGWWSGSVSSMRGKNVNRKDLAEIVERIKKDKSIKYLIVDEPDRFMRSIDEAAYFEVTFRELGVKVWYASDPELNKGDLASKLLKFTKYLSAEGSNEERQNKSISGQTKAIQEGRWPFSPKPGYRRGYERGIQEPDGVRATALQTVLVRMATHQVTPTDALIELNKSAFAIGRSPYKMDKFRVISTDPFYAGILIIDKQVKARNDNGLHEPLITVDQHHELVKIMANKKKNQSGPRKNGNPHYPLSNIVNCGDCTGDKLGRFVGFNHGNGQNKNLVYEKYRCRSCNRYITRTELHSQVESLFKNHKITTQGKADLIDALNVIWKQNENQTEQTITRLRHNIKTAKDSIANQVEAVTDPTNASIKDDILSSIAGKRHLIGDLEEELFNATHEADVNLQDFLEFALGFIKNMGSNFFEISREDRIACKQLVFPGGFYVDANKKVYTTEISPLFRLGTTKGDALTSPNSHLVRVQGL